MRWRLHNLTLDGATDSALVAEAWSASFASLPPGTGESVIQCRFDLVTEVPPAPARPADYRQKALLEYYIDGEQVTIHAPRFGRLYLDLASATTTGELVEAALTTYGVFEDMVAVALSPHLRRRGAFLLHAFAAAQDSGAVLLVGGIGAGKTTTGLALLAGGWQLLSNDSPIITAIDDDIVVRQYPGLLAAYPDTFARFTPTRHLTADSGGPDNGRSPAAGYDHGRPKITVAAEALFNNVWRPEAPVGAILFPVIEDRTDHALTPLTAADTLRRLLPHAVEQWDRALIPQHLNLLRRLAEAAPAYILHLGPNVTAIPDFLAEALAPA